MTALEKWAQAHGSTGDEMRIIIEAENMTNARKVWLISKAEWDSNHGQISESAGAMLLDSLNKSRNGLLAIYLTNIVAGMNGICSVNDIISVIESRSDRVYDGQLTKTTEDRFMEYAIFHGSKLPMLIADIKNYIKTRSDNNSDIKDPKDTEFTVSSTSCRPVIQLTKNMGRIIKARDELRYAANLLQAVIDGKIYQNDVSRALGMSPYSRQNNLAEQFRPYIKSRIINLKELREALRNARSPGDRLLFEILNIKNQIKDDTILFLPDYDEYALWDAVYDCLSKREYEVIRMRTGAATGRPMALEEIARNFNVAQERIDQIKAKALRKLRTPQIINRIFPEINVGVVDCAFGITAAFTDALTHTFMDAFSHTMKTYTTTEKGYRHQNGNRIAARPYTNDADPEDAKETDFETEEYKDSSNSDKPVIPIENADISARLFNCLKRNGIETINQLLDMDCDSITSIRNVGKKTLTEMHKVIKLYFGIDRADLLEKPQKAQKRT